MSDLARITLALLLFAACDGTRGNAPPDAPAAADASTDAAISCRPITLEPIQVTGSTPAGALDAFHYVYARYAGVWCAHVYEIELTTSTSAVDCQFDPRLVFRLPFPIDATAPGSGTFPAEAHVTAGSTDAGTTDVTFEATRIDPPGADAPRIAGRFISTAPGWSLDVDVDLVSQYTYQCP